MSTFEQDVGVDIHNLDMEWERQSSVYLKCSTEFADAMHARDNAKFRLDVCRADLDADIRQDPSEWGLEKITESAVSNAITASGQYKEVMEKYIEAGREVNMLLAAKGALEHKKKALEKLTELYLSGYWSEPFISGEAKKGYEETVSSRSASVLKGSDRMNKLKNKRSSKNGDKQT